RRGGRGCRDVVARARPAPVGYRRRVIHRSSFAPMDVPDVGLAEFVLARVEELGDKAALIDGPSGRTLTYAQLAHTTRAIAAGLAARGFGPGDVFGIFAPNLPEYAAAFHGVAASGGASTTINSLASAEDAAAQLAATRARFLLTVGPFMDRALPAAK